MMYPNKAIQKITEALEHYNDGLISEAEFVAIGLSLFIQMRDRLISGSKQTLATLGIEVPEE